MYLAQDFSSLPAVVGSGGEVIIRHQRREAGGMKELGMCMLGRHSHGTEKGRNRREEGERRRYNTLHDERRKEPINSRFAHVRFFVALRFLST